MTRAMRAGLVACLIALVGGASSADEALVMRALSDELERAIAELRVEGLDRPYFIAYRVDEAETISATASFGALVNRLESRTRELTAEVRVGDYEFDNTNFITLASLRSRAGGAGDRTALTLDDDYQEIRRQVWLATDAAYRSALEQLAEKRAVLQNKSLAEELADFAPSEAREARDERPAPGGRIEDLEELARELSELFRRQPAVFESRVSVTVRSLRTYYVDSEGTRYLKSSPSVGLLAEASTQAADGIPIEDVYAVVDLEIDELPERERLVAEVSELGERLAALRRAELLDRYNGPVLFEGQAAAELLAQAFAPRLLSQREPLVGDERLATFLSRGGPRDFKDRLGARVLPRFLSVTDDPLRAEHGGERLLGGYRVDDQGVPARTVSLIERGYLKRMLAGRTPIAGVEASTGHFRGGGIAPSNLIVSSASTMTDEELRAELLLLVEDRGAEFGVIVRRLGSSAAAGRRDPLTGLAGGSGGADGNNVAPAIVAVQVYPDGREVELRNLELSGFTPSSFKEIIGVGERQIVYSLPFVPAGDLAAALAGRRPSGGAAARPLVTIVTPSLLFEEVTLKKPTDEIPRLPVAPHPYFDAAERQPL